MTEFRVPEMASFSWQLPVLDKDLSAPPVSPDEGDRYIVGPTATGDWSGHENDIAWFDGVDWQFDTPVIGWVAMVEDESDGKSYKFTGSVWDSSGEIDDLDDVPDGSIYGRVKNTELHEGEVTRLEVLWEITDVDDGAKTFTVLGDQADEIEAADTISIQGSTGNDGDYTVVSSTYVPATKSTDIVVSEAVPSAVVDGTIANATTPKKVTGEQALEAYERRGQYNSALKAVIFDIPNGA